MINEDIELELASVVSRVRGIHDIIEFASEDELASINGWVCGLYKVIKGTFNVEFASVICWVRSSCNLRNLLSEHL